jgi:hypothetical protein
MKVSNLFLLVVAAAEAVTKQETSQVTTHRQGADFDSSYLRTRNVESVAVSQEEGTRGGETRNLRPKKEKKKKKEKKIKKSKSKKKKGTCGKSDYQTVYVEFEPPQLISLPVYVGGGSPPDTPFDTLPFTTYDFSETQDTIIQRMEDDLKGFKVSVVQEEPPSSCDYSLITIRSWDDAIYLSCRFEPTGLLDFQVDPQCGPRNYQPGLAEQVDFGNTNKTDTAYINVNFWKTVADFYTANSFKLITGFSINAGNKAETLDVVMTNLVSSPTLMYNTMIRPLALDTHFQILFFRYYLLLLSLCRLQI